MEHPFEKRLRETGLLPELPAPAARSNMPIDGDRYAGAAFRKEIEAVQTAAIGARNDTLNRAAFNLASFVAAGHLDANKVKDALTTAAQTVGLTDTEIHATLGSARRGSAAKVGARATPALTNGHMTEVDAAELKKVTDIETAPLEDIEQGFWNSRESLNTIYTAALARLCSPWAVLACCTSRALTLVRPNTTLPALIGGRGSLNWFSAIVAPSGGGKGAALATARELVKESIYQRNLGSGEGILTAFHGRPSDENPDGRRESVMFVADEVDNVAALSSRTGSTLMATLRSAFSGETLGFSYATKGRDIHLEAHSYRLTLICSIQPGRAATILDDHAGGTPQRFMWFPGMDRRISRKHANDLATHELTLPNLSEWLYPREINVPTEARKYILDQRVRAMSGETDALDAHAIFAREKFAYGLAVLDGRTQMALKDWELAGIAADVSTYTRQFTVDAVRNASRLEAIGRGEIRGIEMAAADAEKRYEESERMRTALRYVLEKVDAAGSDGVSHRELTQKSSKHTRRLLPAVLNLAVADGLIKQVEGTSTWVKL